MFTKRAKIKELAIFFVEHPMVSCIVTENKNFVPVGVSVVMTYRYNLDGMEVSYDKWFVESSDLAKKMNLPGCERHNRLLKGSGVRVSYPEFGTFVFYDKDASDIIDACEFGRDMQSYFVKNQFQKQK